VAAKAVAFARQNQFRIKRVLRFSRGTRRFRILNPRFCGSNKARRCSFEISAFGTKARLWSQSRSGDHGNIRKTC
jgi:hypothetical protein